MILHILKLTFSIYFFFSLEAYSKCKSPDWSNWKFPSKIEKDRKKRVWRMKFNPPLCPRRL